MGRVGESAFALAGSAKVVVVAWLERRVWFAWHQSGRHRIFCGTSRLDPVERLSVNL